ncbi:MAG: sigma-70 family RNA polymerase sigma factor [Williamsia sp.]|nr:sigma-70 family RNA polymerase sigma factor [Williamsia sp.]
MRLLQSLTDTELIDHFHKGHKKAFELLFFRYKEDVRRVIIHYVKDATVAEDLSQEAFIRIYTSIENRKYNEQGKFLPWALRIVRNLCLDHLRKTAQLSPTVQIVYEEWAGATEQPNAEDNLVARQLQLQLFSLLNCLPEEQKKVVCYRYFDGLCFKKIASLMNTSVTTSVARMRYGLAHLRKQINESPACLSR